MLPVYGSCFLRNEGVEGLLPLPCVLSAAELGLPLLLPLGVVDRCILDVRGRRNSVNPFLLFAVLNSGVFSLEIGTFINEALDFSGVLTSDILLPCFNLFTRKL